MREYATQVLADANYQRILPENAIERLRELQRELERQESPTEERKIEDEPPKEEKLPVTEEKPLATEEPQVANDTPPANIPAPIEDPSPVDEQTIRSILIEESLLQSHPSLVRWVSQPQITQSHRELVASAGLSLAPGSSRHSRHRHSCSLR